MSLILELLFASKFFLLRLTNDYENRGLIPLFTEEKSTSGRLIYGAAVADAKF